MKFILVVFIVVELVFFSLIAIATVENASAACDEIEEASGFEVNRCEYRIIKAVFLDSEEVFAAVLKTTAIEWNCQDIRQLADIKGFQLPKRCK